MDIKLNTLECARLLHILDKEEEELRSGDGRGDIEYQLAVVASIKKLIRDAVADSFSVHLAT